MEVMPLAARFSRTPMMAALSEAHYAPAHHGELIQGAFEDDEGNAIRGLVTLPRFDLLSRVRFELSTDRKIEVSPAHKVKALAAAHLTTAHLGLIHVGGYLQVESNIAEELGLGSSTSEVVATIRAVSSRLGHALAPEVIARIAVAAEAASDSLMYTDSTVLFAHREGRVLEVLGPLIPPIGILSFTCGDPVNTVALRPAAYSWQDVQRFRPILGLLRFGVQTRNVQAIAKAATLSACINQAYLPKRHFDQILKIAEAGGALGVQVAHSGSLVGVMVDPYSNTAQEQAKYLRRQLQLLDVPRVEFFVAGGGLFNE